MTTREKFKILMTRRLHFYEEIIKNRAFKYGDYEKFKDRSVCNIFDGDCKRCYFKDCSTKAKKSAVYLMAMLSARKEGAKLSNYTVNIIRQHYDELLYKLKRKGFKYY
jgi:hypothetical protein